MPALGYCLRASLLCLAVASPFTLKPQVLAQRGAITQPRDLADLTLGADRIVQGRVEAVHVEAHPTYPNLRILVLTLAPDDVLKGTAGARITLHQFLWDIRDLADNAGYRPGDEVLLFLNRPTSLGLVSPVGLEQGRFRIQRASTSSNSLAINGAGNRNLLQGAVASGRLRPRALSPATRSAVQNFTGGPIPLSALKESVRALLATPAEAR